MLENHEICLTFLNKHCIGPFLQHTKIEKCFIIGYFRIKNRIITIDIVINPIPFALRLVTRLEFIYSENEVLLMLVCFYDLTGDLLVMLEIRIVTVEDLHLEVTGEAPYN